MANIYETSKVCERAGLTYDGIHIGITKDDVIKLKREYNAHCLGVTPEEYDRLIEEHELKMQEEYRKNISNKKRRFW